ncbi:major facilitator superfamily domain-containing protein [Naematelia encephala]|uniref:Major facilitator superfamily domain-containing protein n=1 Tax=Naematelia encephala TaxID=71784 RepID=A0A1Y2BF91_9TREE|nr:major facilitator superfamily domain-containing protein [Naematelia encephala]
MSIHDEHDTVRRPGSDDIEASLPEKSPVQEQSATEFERPEGGWAAWSTVIGAWLFMFATFGYTNAFGVFQSYYTVSKYPTKSSSDVAWIGSLQTFLQFGMGAIAGPLFDRGYFYQLTIVGSAVFLVCFFTMSLANQFWETFLSQGVGLGIGIGLIFLPALGVVSQYFKKRLGIATGFVTTGSSIGGICIPIMLNNLIVSHGFEKAVQYTGCLLAGCLVLAMVLIRPFGGVRARKDAIKANPREFLKDPVFVLCIVGIFFGTWGIFFPVFYLQYFAVRSGASDNLVFYILAIFNAGSVVGRTLPNFAADYFGSFNLLAIMCISSAAMIFALFGANDTGGLIAVAVLLGVSTGAFVSLMGPCVMSTAKDQSEIGARMGVCFLLMSVAALTGAPVAGALVDKYQFSAGIIWCGVLLILAAGLIACAALITTRRKGTWKV